MMQQLKRFSLLPFFFLLLLNFSLAQAQEHPVPLNPEVHLARLDNGMTYYIQQNAKPEKKVEMRLVIRAGSVLEDDDQRGMAHFVEHMAFNGTRHFEKNELVRYLQSLGVGFGADLNASTSFDETIYTLSLPSDSAEVLDKGFQIMADWSRHITFDSAEIEKERGVVLEEWRKRKSAGERMWAKVWPVLLKGSKYAQRMPIGTETSIRESSQEAIKRFYKDWYRAELAALVVVGDIEPVEIEQKIKAAFADWQTPENPRPRETFPLPDHQEPLFCIVSDKENPATYLSIFYKLEKKPLRSTDDYLRQISYKMFTSMFNRRLSELFQQPDPPFLGARASYISDSRESAFTLNLNVAENGIEKGLKAILKEGERVKKFGFTQQELDRYKTDMLKDLEQAYNERDKTESAHLTGAYVQHFLEQVPAPGISFYYHFINERLDEIKLENINQLAEKWIKGEGQVVILMAPEKEGLLLPAETDLKRILNEVSAENIAPWQEKELPAELIAQKPVAGKIVAENAIKDLGIRVLRLSNGIKVMLKPTDFKNDEVLMSGRSFGGTSQFPESYYMSARLAVPVVTESGLGKFSRFDLKKMLAGKNIYLQPYINYYQKGFRGKSSGNDLEAMLQLIHLYFTAPRKDQAAYASLISRRKAASQNLLMNPLNVFSNEIAAIKFPDIRRNTPIPEMKEWDKISQEQIYEIYQKSFENAGSFDFCFVGAFDPEKIRPLLETYLGSLPSTGKEASYVDLNIRPTQGPLDKKIYKGTEPKALVIASLENPVEYSLAEAHKVWSLANILNRIFTEKIREEMSGVYSMNISMNLNRIPYSHFSMNLHLPCAPEKADTLLQAAFAEIEKIKQYGIPEAELQKEIESQRRQIEEDLKTNSGWLWRLAAMKTNQEDFSRLRQPYALIKVVNSEELQQAAIKYLDLSKSLRFTLLPEAGSISHP